MPDYADTETWKPWQRDYRLGVFLIIPPEYVSRRNEPLRARHDPVFHAICPLHVTVSDPLRHEMTPALEAEIRAILRSIEPFDLRRIFAYRAARLQERFAAG